MNFLVACEESQTTMKAFRELGHNAFSCDLKDCSGGFPQYHIKADCFSVLYNGCWDLVIAHPPCTYLSKAGSCNLVRNGVIFNHQRFNDMLAAREFFMKFYDFTGCPICIENPVPMAICDLPPFSQTIQPYQFGDDWTKLTCLWLKGLPYLIPLNYCLNSRSPGIIPSYVGSCHGSTLRSKSFPGIAKAMAEQWGNL